MRIYDATELAYKRGYQDGREDALCLRPCLADGKPATFHRWMDEDRALLQTVGLLNRADQMRASRLFREEGLVDVTHKIEKLRICCALVEYPDGSVGKVKPELIQFLDRKEG